MKKLILSIVILASAFISKAQSVAINSSGSAADASALLDVTSTSKGVLIPRMTQAQRNAISSPATGLMIYQTDNTPGFYYYNGSSWTTMGGSSSSATIDLVATHTGSQSLSAGGSSVTPDDVVFNNVVTSPSIGSYNNATGVYTVGTTGTYMITVHILGTGALAINTPPQLLVNGTTVLYGVGIGNTNLPTGQQQRGELTAILSLSATNQVKIKAAVTNTTNTVPLSTDGTTRFTIVKL